LASDPADSVVLTSGRVLPGPALCSECGRALGTIVTPPRALAPQYKAQYHGRGTFVDDLRPEGPRFTILCEGEKGEPCKGSFSWPAPSHLASSP